MPRKALSVEPALSIPDALFSMEPDLQMLRGLLIACRILGEADDHIEPEAVGALAHCGWRHCQRNLG